MCVEPGAAQLPMSYPADAALVADAPLTITVADATEQIGSFAAEDAQPKQGSPMAAPSPSSMENSVSSQGLQGNSAGETASQSGAAAAGTSREVSTAQGPRLARKKSVRFADNDPASVRAALVAAAVACSSMRRPLPGRAAGQPVVGTGPPLQPQPAFCWRVLDECSPGDILDVRLEESYSLEQGMLPRRSVDLRMADAATLPMAAFGGNGMETSSAVIRSLQASHERR